MSSFSSKTIDRYFNCWIRAESWESMHPHDMESFYMFLKALKRYRRKPWWDNFRDNIVKAVKEYHSYSDEEWLNERIDIFLSTAATIFSYESAPFPNPLVEMGNPYAVSLALHRQQNIDEKGRSHPFYTDKQVEEILIKNFGEDWRNRYRS